MRGGGAVAGMLFAYVGYQVIQRIERVQKWRISKTLMAVEPELKGFKQGPLFLKREEKHAFVSELFNGDPGGPIVITGPQGSGKTMIVKRALSNRPQCVYLDLRKQPVATGTDLTVNFVQQCGYLLPPNELLGRAIFTRDAVGASTLAIELDRGLKLITDVLRKQKSAGWRVTGTGGSVQVLPPLFCIDELNTTDLTALTDDPTFWRFIDWTLFVTDNRLAHVVFTTSLEVSDSLDAYNGFRSRRQKVHIDFPRPASVHDYFHRTLNPFLDRVLHATPRPRPMPPSPEAGAVGTRTGTGTGEEDGRAGRPTLQIPTAERSVDEVGREDLSPQAADPVTIESAGKKQSWLMTLLFGQGTGMGSAAASAAGTLHASAGSVQQAGAPSGINATAGTPAGEAAASGASRHSSETTGTVNSSTVPVEAALPAATDRLAALSPSVPVSSSPTVAAVAGSAPSPGQAAPPAQGAPTLAASASSTGAKKGGKALIDEEGDDAAEGEGPSLIVAVAKAKAQEQAAQHQTQQASASSKQPHTITSAAAQTSAVSSPISPAAAAAAAATSPAGGSMASTVQLSTDFSSTPAAAGPPSNSSASSVHLGPAGTGNAPANTAAANTVSTPATVPPVRPITASAVSEPQVELSDDGSLVLEGPVEPEVRPTPHSPSSPVQVGMRTPAAQASQGQADSVPSVSAGESDPRLMKPAGGSPHSVPTSGTAPVTRAGPTESRSTGTAAGSTVSQMQQQQQHQTPAAPQAQTPSTSSALLPLPPPPSFTFPQLGTGGPFLLDAWEIERIVDTIGGHLKDLDTVVTAIVTGKSWAAALERLVADSVEHVERLLEQLLVAPVDGTALPTPLAQPSGAGVGASGTSAPSALPAFAAGRRTTVPRARLLTAAARNGQPLPTWDYQTNPRGDRLASYGRYLRAWALITELSSRKYVSKRELADRIFAGCPHELEYFSDVGLILSVNVRAATRVVITTDGGLGASPGRHSQQVSLPGTYVTASSPRMRQAFRALVSDPRLQSAATRSRAALALAKLRDEETLLLRRLPEAMSERQYWQTQLNSLIIRDTALRTSVAKELVAMMAAAPVSGIDFLIAGSMQPQEAGGMISGVAAAPGVPPGGLDGTPGSPSAAVVPTVLRDTLTGDGERAPPLASRDGSPAVTAAMAQPAAPVASSVQSQAKAAVPASEALNLLGVRGLNSAIELAMAQLKGAEAEVSSVRSRLGEVRSALDAAESNAEIALPGSVETLAGLGVDVTLLLPGPNRRPRPLSAPARNAGTEAGAGASKLGGVSVPSSDGSAASLSGERYPYSSYEEGVGRGTAGGGVAGASLGEEGGPDVSPYAYGAIRASQADLALSLEQADAGAPAPSLSSGTAGGASTGLAVPYWRTSLVGRKRYAFANRGADMGYSDESDPRDTIDLVAEDGPMGRVSEGNRGRAGGRAVAMDHSTHVASRVTYAEDDDDDDDDDDQRLTGVPSMGIRQYGPPGRGSVGMSTQPAGAAPQAQRGGAQGTGRGRYSILRQAGGKGQRDDGSEPRRRRDGSSAGSSELPGQGSDRSSGRVRGSEEDQDSRTGGARQSKEDEADAKPSKPSGLGSFWWLR